MSSEATAPKKRTPAEGASRTAHIDHRKRRRNRTTQSCLNCHTSKRMCDRKRPCGRCTQLGLTGLCIYEIDDPSQRRDDQDEKSRLQSRVAELERVIRELKNKPHPRWVQAQMQAASQADASEFHTSARQDPTAVASQSPVASSPSSTSMRIDVEGSFPNIQIPSSPDRSHSSPSRPHILIETASPSSGSYPLTFDSPQAFNCPSPLVLTPRDDVHRPSVAIASDGQDEISDGHLANFFSAGYPTLGMVEDGLFGDLLDRVLHSESSKEPTAHLGTCPPSTTEHREGHCGCLNEPSSYTVVLELTLRLRKAAEILGRSKRHQTESACLLHQLIVELDNFVANTVGNVAPPTGEVSGPTINRQGRHLLTTTLAGMRSRPDQHAPATLSTAMPPSLTSFRPAQGSWKDSFLSWDPSR
ncbi:hypothetical protein NEOLEDRAFT_1127754 [Neolentinus lepideus HHB14362 ss-1]|uniref:Zn(2)-C6 fungal-type domain-containing protein n=1 Tax=Neolentinus lepideus HHB14362 ss-1 TaxID=1314782 RepID=A0A165VLX4_9AGAM|nr:hypothetical protein NEOLEDRAFT_1127754 [Neolentinus lepideus HHB14362 ss-1]